MGCISGRAQILPLSPAPQGACIGVGYCCVTRLKAGSCGSVYNGGIFERIPKTAAERKIESGGGLDGMGQGPARGQKAQTTALSQNSVSGIPLHDGKATDRHGVGGFSVSGDLLQNPENGTLMTQKGADLP